MHQRVIVPTAASQVNKMVHSWGKCCHPKIHTHIATDTVCTHVSMQQGFLTEHRNTPIVTLSHKVRSSLATTPLVNNSG